MTPPDTDAAAVERQRAQWRAAAARRRKKRKPAGAWRVGYKELRPPRKSS